MCVCVIMETNGYCIDIHIASFIIEMGLQKTN